MWTYALSGGRRIDLTTEVGVSYWRAKQSGPNDALWQLNAVPMLRWWPTDRVFIEAGIGATLFNKTRFVDKELSTAFQFGDHLGLGYQVSPGTRLGLRVSHFSNGSIKSPNPGLDLFQLTWVQRF